MAKGLLYRRKMAEIAEVLENEIHAFLLKEGKESVIIEGLWISIGEDGQVKIKELPALDLNQQELPLKLSEE